MVINNNLKAYPQGVSVHIVDDAPLTQRLSCSASINHRKCFIVK